MQGNARGRNYDIDTGMFGYTLYQIAITSFPDTRALKNMMQQVYWAEESNLYQGGRGMGLENFLAYIIDTVVFVTK